MIKMMTMMIMMIINTYRDFPDAFFKIGVARKCFTTTRTLGVAIGVVDRAAQQSEKIQQEKGKMKTDRVSPPSLFLISKAQSRLSLAVGSFPGRRKGRTRVLSEASI